MVSKDRTLSKPELVALCDAFLRLPGMSERSTRDLYVDVLSSELDNALSMPRYLDPRHDIWSLLHACREQPGGLRTLVNVMRSFHRDLRTMMDLDDLIEHLFPEVVLRLVERAQLISASWPRGSLEKSMFVHPGRCAVVKDTSLVEPGGAGELGAVEPGGAGELGVFEPAGADFAGWQVEVDKGGGGEVEVDGGPRSRTGRAFGRLAWAMRDLLVYRSDTLVPWARWCHVAVYAPRRRGKSGRGRMQIHPLRPRAAAISLESAGRPSS